MTATDSSLQTAAQIEDWLKAHIANLIGQTPDEIDGDADFDSFGIDSVQGVDMVVALETWLDMPDDLPMELLFEAPTLADAAQRVADAKKAQVARS